jgi:lysophospholipase L1-like esterase
MRFFGPIQLFICVCAVFNSSFAFADDFDPSTLKMPTGTLVCVGASVTEGALASRLDRCYVSDLQKLAVLSNSDLQVVNLGISGFSTGAYAYKAEEKALHVPLETTLITIELGTNDTRANKPADAIAAEAAANLERLIKAYQARVPRARIVLITPTMQYPQKFTASLRSAGYDEGGPEKLKAIDAAYAGLAKRLGLQLIDISAIPTEEDTTEGVHPTDLGHAKMALLIWQQLGGPTSDLSPEQLAELPGRPQLKFDRPEVQSLIGVVYRDALSNLLDKNTMHPKKPGAQDPLGWMTSPPGTYIRAGGGYDQPWTRDSSLNSWFAGSLLEPAVARNTLWAVCQRRGDGSIVIQQDNQWWDQCIWAKAAWNHYCVTGDRAFLEAAYPAVTASLAILRQKHFNPTYGLYMGPAFFADGIAAYPPPEYDSSNHSSFVLDHRHTSELMVLSTNCIYREAYRCAARMARELGRPEEEATELDGLSDALKSSINQHLWSDEAGAYAYFLSSAGPDAGKLYMAQEGGGQAFALLFDVADQKQAAAIIQKMHHEPHGIVTLWPNLPEFDDQHLGRHNVMLWPLVNGLWAQAAAKTQSPDAFASELEHIAGLVLGSDHNFYEIYNPRTGKPDGGWQNGGHWGPVPDQTWSATSYIGAIHYGLFGMSFTPQGLHLAPVLPEGWGSVTLRGLVYRRMQLSIHLSGHGSSIAKATLDGKPMAGDLIPSNLAWQHRVEIELKDAQ